MHTSRYKDKLEVSREEYEKDIELWDEENMELKKQIAKMEVLQQKKISKMEKKMKELKRAHALDVAELKEDLENTQEVHNNNLINLRNVPEMGHDSWEVEAMQLTE